MLSYILSQGFKSFFLPLTLSANDLNPVRHSGLSTLASKMMQNEGINGLKQLMLKLCYMWF